MKLVKNISKGINAIGSVGGLASDVIDIGSNGTKIFKEKIDSSIEEEKMQQAAERILKKANLIKKISKSLNISAAEAAELLEQEMERE